MLVGCWQINDSAASDLIVLTARRWKANPSIGRAEALPVSMMQLAHGATAAASTQAPAIWRLRRNPYCD